MSPSHERRLAALTLALLAMLLAWDSSGLDMPLARLFGDTHGFALSQHAVLTTGLHDGARLLSWLFVVALTLAVWWPVGWLRRLHRIERLQLVISALACALAVALFKSFSTTSCPWDLAAFGGTAQHVSHWLRSADGGSGHCFPAGHASSGFAFVGGYFALLRSSRAHARTWLGASLAAGLLLGVAQQARGAHFMSHTLWTGWLCWALAFGLDACMRRCIARKRLSVGPPAPPPPPWPTPDRPPRPANPSTPLRG
ncbi:MAG: phosphatase PAP2 family protein [Rhizobacter sp.]|nr:phosphatase PAP2 family protein [Rhizobacter sp.]